MARYRATIAGYTDRLIQPGDVIEVNGEPPILGLVPVDDEPAERPVLTEEDAAADLAGVPRPSKKGRRAKQTDDEPDPI